MEDGLTVSGTERRSKLQKKQRVCRCHSMYTLNPPCVRYLRHGHRQNQIFKRSVLYYMLFGLIFHLICINNVFSAFFLKCQVSQLWRIPCHYVAILLTLLYQFPEICFFGEALHVTPKTQCAL